ncbi:3544_t:CDS:2, partial [Paraglomus occultum]
MLVNDVIEIVIQDAHHLSMAVKEDFMPLQGHNLSNLVGIVERNVNNNFRNSMSKPYFSFPFCAGAPGISKTQMGQELFKCIKEVWVPPHWQKLMVHFEYIHMDFGNGIQLDTYDMDLSATIIIGLWITYVFFIKGKYDMQFFQLVDQWDREIVNNRKLAKDLFKNMINNLAPFLYGLPTTTFVQTFLSGMAPQVVIAAKETSRVLFDFVLCPQLLFQEMIKIVDHYSERFGARKLASSNIYEWMLCQPFLQLLEDTGGLPHTLELLFQECFELTGSGENFFHSIHEQHFNTIFGNIKSVLQTHYKIYQTVSHNQ